MEVNKRSLAWVIERFANRDAKPSQASLKREQARSSRPCLKTGDYVTDLTDSAREAASVFENTLKADGWEVETTLTPAGVHIEVDHPLSSPYGFNFRNDASDHLPYVRSSLLGREFFTIAARPEDIPHADLLKRLREVAAANRWDPKVLAVLAQVLESQSLLTTEESEWLESAGAAWSDKSA